jgi:phage regulator Rha-like protein
MHRATKAMTTLFIRCPRGWAALGSKPRTGGCMNARRRLNQLTGLRTDCSQKPRRFDSKPKSTSARALLSARSPAWSLVEVPRPCEPFSDMPRLLVRVRLCFRNRHEHAQAARPAVLLMSNLTIRPTSAVAMTSKEMAILSETWHDNVKRTIETLANQGVISYPQIVDGEKAANGVIEKLYRIGKRDSYVVVAQLSPEFTARLVDRWQALEAQRTFQLPDFNNPILATHAWADQAVKVQALSIESADQQQQLAVS